MRNGALGRSAEDCSSLIFSGVSFLTSVEAFCISGFSWFAAKDGNIMKKTSTEECGPVRHYGCHSTIRFEINLLFFLLFNSMRK